MTIQSGQTLLHYPVLALALAVMAPVGVAMAATSHGPPAGRWVHEVWTVEDGLPVQSVTDILQSHDGYLWVATFDGLARFDGVRFTVFDSGNSEGLPSSRITRLLEDRDDNLWLLTEQGHVVRFEGGAFRTIEPEQAPASGAIDVLYEDPLGKLWAGGVDGLSRVEDGRLIPIERDRIRGRVTAILHDGHEVLWVGLRGGSALRYHAGEVTSFPPVSRSHADVKAIFVDHDGSTWIGTGSGADRVVGGERLPLDLENLPRPVGVVAFHRQRDGSFWLGTSAGFFRWDEGRLNPMDPASLVASIEHASIKTGPTGETWFATRDALYCDGVKVLSVAGQIRGFTFDHEGSLWFATDATGLHRLKPGLFEVFGLAEGLASDIVYPVIEDRSGAVWAGTFNSGLSRLLDGVVTTYTEDDGLPRDLIRALHVDRKGDLWVGIGGDRFGGGVCRMRGERCVSIGPRGEGVSRASVLAIHQDREGTMWFGTADHGLYSYREGSWNRWTTTENLPHDGVRTIHESADGSLWLATNGGGLIRMRDGRLTRLTTADGLSSDLLRAIYEDREGALWIGTEGRGLNRLTFSGATPSVTVYRKSDGLFDEVIHQILEDDYGRLWMSTNRGLFWVTLADLRAFASGEIERIQSRAYTERDGLRSREANGGVQPAGIKASDGRLWFPTQGGLAVVDPSRLRRNEAPPPVVIEEIVSDGRTRAPRGDEPTIIDPGGRDLEIHYTALSFQEPSNVLFRYRLEGYDADWVEAGNRRTAYYTNVPAGEYELRVIAANNDGVWNLDGARVRLSVTPRWFEQVWFRPATALLLLIGAWSAYRWRSRSLEQRREELEALVDSRTRELVREKESSERATTEAERQRRIVEAQAERLRELDEAKSRFFANVSHEFRTPLTLTIGPLEDLRDGMRGELSEAARNDIDLALRNSRRLLGFINEILEIARLESGQLKLQSEPRDLGVLLRDRCQAFAGLAERSRIELRIDVPSEPLIAEIDPELSERVVDNLLSNAVRHTEPGGYVSVCLSVVQDERARLSIRDSGSGIPAADLPHVFERFYRGDESRTSTSLRTGIGLALSKELVELHGGTISVTSEEGEGSEFVVTLPLSSAVLPTDGASENRRPSPAIELPDDVTAEPVPDEDIQEAADVTTVLVVDDNADLRAYLRRHLEQHYRVLEAADGEAGLEQARRHLPDLVVSDVLMPRMNGQELCRAMRADPELACIPVVLLTARAGSGDRIEGLSHGADDYLTKPFDAAELLARLANLIAVRRRLRDRLRKEAALQPREVEAPSEDERFLERVRAVIEAHLSDEDFGVNQLAEGLDISRGHLHRRLRDVLSTSPTDVVRSIRLDRAAQLLKARAGTVSEVAYATGFQSVSHFCRCFKQRFGQTPSAYREGEVPPPGD